MNESPRSAHLLADVWRHAPRPTASTLSPHIFLDAARRRRLALALSMVVALALAAGYIAVTPKKYASTTTLLIDARLAQLSQTEASASVVDQAAVESQIELLRSEKVLLSVISKLDLWSDPEFGRSSAGLELNDPTSAELARRRTVALVGASLWVTRIGRSYLVSVSFTSVDPAKATRIANAVAEAYISDQIGTKIAAARQQTAYLEQRVDENRSRAAEAYRAVQAFKGEHDINPLRDLGVQQEIHRLTAEASRARALTLALRAGLDRADALLAEPSQARVSVPDATLLRSFADPVLDALLEGLAADRARLPSAEAAPNHDETALARLKLGWSYMIRDVWARVAALRDQLYARWVVEDAKQQAMDSALADVRLRDTRARIVQGRLRELETDAATARSLYETYLNQLTHAGQQQAVPSSDARVISAAAIPLLPNTPKKPLILVLAALSGAAFGVAVAFLLETMDDVVRTRMRLEALTALPCLGVIPRVGARPRSRRRDPDGRRRSHRLLQFDLAEPRSKAGNTLRNLQLAACAGPRETVGIVLGVTSPIAGAGKTTVAFNLAISVCRSGRRVLLVDADLRSGALTRTACGYKGDGMWSGATGNTVRLAEGFDVLPASATGAVAGAEMPDGKPFEATLAEARYSYDVIIVDLPAILPLTEVRAAVQSLDHIILVLRWGATTGAQVKRAMNCLGNTDRFIGTVLNRAKSRTMRRFEGSLSRSYAD